MEEVGVLDEVGVVVKVILRRSIMSCSADVLTGAGGLGRTKALLGIADETATSGWDKVVLTLTGTSSLPLTVDTSGGDACRSLVCLQIVCNQKKDQSV